MLKSLSGFSRSGAARSPTASSSLPSRLRETRVSGPSTSLLQSRAPTRRRRPRSALRYILRGRSQLGLLVLTIAIGYVGLLTLQWWLQSGPSSSAGGVCASRLTALGLLEPSGMYRATRPVPAYTLQRRQLYANLSAQLELHGLSAGGAMTQGLTTRDLFSLEQGHVQRRLHALSTPVRAVVAPLLDAHAMRMLSAALQEHLLPVVGPAGMWVQDSTMLHATLFHASAHKHPVAASASEVAAEVSALQRAASKLCPVRVALERVVLTTGGNVVACWQVVTGSDPVSLRGAFGRALPRAPKLHGQAFTHPFILHTTLARILPQQSVRPGERRTLDLAAAMKLMTEALCGVQATLQLLWYVIEEDLLALALNGRYQKADLSLDCRPERERVT